MNETHIELIPFKTFSPCKTETLAKSEDTQKNRRNWVPESESGREKRSGLITNRTVPQRRGMIRRRTQEPKKGFVGRINREMETEAQWSKGVFPFLYDSSFLSRSVFLTAMHAR